MSRIFAIARLNLLQLFRDRSELLSFIVLPLVLTWVFGTAFGSGNADRPLMVPVADADGTVYSKVVVEAIHGQRYTDTYRVTEGSARKLVANGTAPVAIIVPEGFGKRIEDDEKARIYVLRDPASSNGQMVTQVVEGAATRIAANAEAVRVACRAMNGADTFADLFAYADDMWEPQPPVGVESRVITANAARVSELEAPTNTQYSLGFTVFFVMMVALGSAGGIIEEREIGTLRRLLATPVTRMQVLVGKTLGVALVASFEAAMLVGFGALVFGVQWGKDPLAVALILVSLVLAATGIGVMVSALVRTRSQMGAITPVLSTAMAMLGGCYWPLDITSPLMQQVGRLTPTGWAMIGLKDIVARGMGIEAALLPAAVLLSMAAVTLVIGMTRLRLE
ncbi:MAG TPA: ABC transporter permease [Coriobacteriia bacterium]|nr:ABC transporter permease [Coriobacteriia bacterium]